MSQKARFFEEKYETLERNHKRIAKDFNDSISTHEQQRKVSEADAEELRTQLQNERILAEQQLENAASELATYKKRLDIANMQIEKLTGISRSGTENAPIHGSFITGSNLLKMIQQYESNGKRWEDIYGDYFDMCEEIIKLKAENADLKNRGEKYYRGEVDKQQLYGRMDNELQHFRKKCQDLERSLCEHILLRKIYQRGISAADNTQSDLRGHRMRSLKPMSKT